jgi:hypothetical protein
VHYKHSKSPTACRPRTQRPRSNRAGARLPEQLVSEPSGCLVDRVANAERGLSGTLHSPVLIEGDRARNIAPHRRGCEHPGGSGRGHADRAGYARRWPPSQAKTVGRTGLNLAPWAKPPKVRSHHRGHRRRNRRRSGHIRRLRSRRARLHRGGVAMRESARP